MAESIDARPQTRPLSEELPSRGNTELHKQVPIQLRELLTKQLLGDPEDPQDTGSIERYRETRDLLARGGFITPEQADQLPEMQNAAIQILLEELYPDDNDRWRKFNPAFNFSNMRRRLVDCGLIIDLDKLAKDPAIRSAVATIIKNEGNLAKKTFLSGQFTAVGIPPEIWQTQGPHVNLLHGATQEPLGANRDQETLSLDSQEIPVHTRELLAEQLLTTDVSNVPDDEEGITRYIETVQRFIDSNVITSEHAQTLSKLPEIQNAVVQLLLRSLSGKQSGTKYYPAYSYSVMIRRLIKDGVITDSTLFNEHPVIRGAVQIILADAYDDTNRTFLTEEFKKIGILDRDENS